MNQPKSSQQKILTQSPWPELLVFGVSILATLAFWIAFPGTFHHETSDYERFYEPVAREILNGNGIAYVNGAPATLYPPGYPILIATVFRTADVLSVSEQSVLSGFSLVCMGIASVLFFRLVKSVWGVLSALVWSLVWITYPFGLWLTKNPNSEIPFMMVFYGALCILWSSLTQKSRDWPIYFLSGLLTGIAMLIRPIAIGAPFVMGAILWVAGNWMSVRSRVFLITIMLLGNFIAVFPWEAWVYSKTGRVIPLATNGPAGLLDGLTFGVSMPEFEFRQAQRIALPQDVLALMDKIKGRSSELESVADFASLIKEELHTNPFTVGKLFLIKLARSWYGIESHRFEALSIVIQIPYILLVLWSSKLAWQQGGIKQQFVISIWLMILYFWTMNTLASNILRYMVPAMGLSFVILPVLLDQKRRLLGSSDVIA